MKYARMRDKNERAIIDALKAAGASVTQLDGAGVPDLLVGYDGHMVLLEVKLPLGARGGTRGQGGGSTRVGQGGNGVLSEAQVKWWASWKGTPALVVRTPDEALAVLRAFDAALAVEPTPDARKKLRKSTDARDYLSARKESGDIDLDAARAVAAVRALLAAAAK